MANDFWMSATGKYVVPTAIIGGSFLSCIALYVVADAAGWTNHAQAAQSATARSTSATSTTSPTTQTTAVAPAKPAAMTVPVAQLISAYKKNEVAADQQFKGVHLRTTGVVQSIAVSMGSPQIELNSDGQESVLAVRCLASKNQSDAIARLSNGQRVTVEGDVTGKMFDVVLDDCTIVQ